MSNYLWLLDAGHGGVIDGVYQTKGKRSPIWPDGRVLYEGEFNRAVVTRLANLLDAAGIDYIKIADTLEDTPLWKRSKEINEIYADDKRAIAVSVHANAGGGTGWEVFTSPGQTKSDTVAKVFYETHELEFKDIRFRPDWSDGDPDKEAKFHMLTKTHCPAILTENFFMDTLEPDCEILMSCEGRGRVAKAHFDAIRKIEETEPI